MIHVNIFDDIYNKNRVPDFRDSVQEFSELVEVFEHYGEKHKLGHLINFWSSDSDELIADNLKESNVLMFDYDIHGEYKNDAHYLNSIKYVYTYKSVQRLLESLNLNYIMYKTKSYTIRKQCFRVVLPLTDSISHITSKRLLKWLKMSTYELRTLDEVSFRNQIFLLPFNPIEKVKVESKIDGVNLDLYSDNGFLPLFREDLVIKKEKEDELEFESIEIGSEIEEETKLKEQLERMNWKDGKKHIVLVGIIYAYMNKGLNYQTIKSIVAENTSFYINWKLYDNLR